MIQVHLNTLNIEQDTRIMDDQVQENVSLLSLDVLILRIYVWSRTKMFDRSDNVS